MKRHRWSIVAGTLSAIIAMAYIPLAAMGYLISGWRGLGFVTFYLAIAVALLFAVATNE